MSNLKEKIIKSINSKRPLLYEDGEIIGADETLQRIFTKVMDYV